MTVALGKLQFAAKRDDLTSDINVYRSTNELIKQYGEDAPVEAALRADELMEAGDMEGVTVWKLILTAIEELLSEEPPSDEHLH